MRPHTPSDSASARVCRSSSSTTSGRSVCGGSAQAESPECTPASSTCSMTPAMRISPVAVAHGVDVDLDRVLQEAVHQHGPIGGDTALPGERAGRHRLHDPAHAVVVVDDLHGPAAQDVARAQQHRVADLPRDGQRLVAVVAVPPGGCGMSSSRHSAFQRSRSSARSMEAGLVPRTSSGGREPASLSGVCPPRDTMTPCHRPAGRQLGIEHVGHVLVGQRLEVEAVRGVVVGRDRLGVAVDHHRLVAGVAQRHGGVHAAVVELDALADAVRARTRG